MQAASEIIEGKTYEEGMHDWNPSGITIDYLISRGSSFLRDTPAIMALDPQTALGPDRLASIYSGAPAGWQRVVHRLNGWLCTGQPKHSGPVLTAATAWQPVPAVRPRGQGIGSSRTTHEATRSFVGDDRTETSGILSSTARLHKHPCGPNGRRPIDTYAHSAPPACPDGIFRSFWV
jgi:hypothetical protein